MMEFIHETHTPRVIFGEHSLSSVKAELELLGATSITFISDENTQAVAQKISAELGEKVNQEITQVAMHVPDEFSEPIISTAAELGINAILAIGGGSSTGLGKIMALELNLPLVVIPTTYAGSEMTPIWGRTRNKEKITGVDRKVLPKTVLYAPQLTHTLPLSITVNSGMNAIAHAVEALYAPQLSPLVELAALKGIEVMAQGLRKIANSLDDHSAREDLFYGAMLCGFALGNSKMGIHHKICHTLGGMYNLPHAQMHSAVLPYAVKYNEGVARIQMSKVAEILGAENASQGLWDLSTAIGAETSLGKLNFPATESAKVADFMSSYPLVNPRAFDYEIVVKLLQAASSGSRPDDESW